MDLENEIDKQSKEAKDLSSKLEKKNAEISSLQRTCNELEQYSRRNTVRVFGISEKSGEDTFD